MSAANALIQAPGIEFSTGAQAGAAEPKIILLAGRPGSSQRIVRQVLSEERHRLLQTRTGDEIFEVLHSGLVDLVVMSLQDSAAEELDCCRKIKQDPTSQLIPVLMITNGASWSQIAALAAGADGILYPPFDPELARAQVRALLRHKAATDRLEQPEGILFALARTVEYRDHATSGHCDRLSLFSLAMGMALSLGDADLLALYRGGYLHDIGKLGVPDKVLNKPGGLDAKEWEEMRAHTTRGEEICRPMRSLAKVLPIIRHHHERWDGSGYPDGLKGGQIPLLARVLQFSDIYDALTHQRPYKVALPPGQALEIMQQETGRGWRDPELMQLFAALHAGAGSQEIWREAHLMQRSLHNLQQHLTGS